jgi:hypothetical protein
MFKIHEWDGAARRWDVADMRGPDVFWTADGGASYILARTLQPPFFTADGREAELISIDGGGRPRWNVTRTAAKFDAGARSAVDHFRLRLA